MYVIMSGGIQKYFFERPHSQQEFIFTFCVLIIFFVAISQWIIWAIESEVERMENEDIEFDEW